MVNQSHLTQQIVLSLCREYKIMSADIFCRCDATIDQLIDVIEGNRRYIPCIYVLNKIDQLTIEELDIIDQMPHHVPISAAHEWNLEELLENVWEYTKMIRIYTKVCVQCDLYVYMWWLAVSNVRRRLKGGDKCDPTSILGYRYGDQLATIFIGKLPLNGTSN